MRETIAVGMNERAEEHSRLARRVEEKRRLMEEFKSHAYEAEYWLAVKALEDFSGHPLAPSV